jgi:6-phosphogluconolactonase (cycloisomerase 2 family)
MVLTTRGVHAQAERPPTPSSSQILFVANGQGASVQAFRVASDGQMTEVAGSPFAAPPNVNLLRVAPDRQTLIASAAEGLSAPTSTLAVYHITTAGALVDTGTEVTLSGSTRQFAFVTRDGQTFVYVPTAANPGGDRIHGFARTGTGPATAVAELPWSPLAVNLPSGFMLFGGAAASPDGALLFQVGYSASEELLEVGPEGSLTPRGDFVNSAGGATNVVTSPDGMNVYVSDDSVPPGAGNGIHGLSITPTGDVVPLAGSPFLVPGSGTPSHLAISPNGRFLAMGADSGELVQVMRRALDGSLTLAGTLQFFQTPGAVACGNRFLFTLATEQSTGARQVLVYRFAEDGPPVGPIESVEVDADARGLVLR